jgi:serine/threonine protein phosphatase PrpC
MGPPRVWIKQQDIPGLAMTRSFGDEVASTVGITAMPEITEWQLTPEDKFLILASDGVWEFLESEEVLFIL